MKKILLTLFVTVALMASACAPQSPKATTRVFTDSCGREVTIPIDIHTVAATGAMPQMVLLPIAGDMFCGLASDWSSEAALYISSDILALPVYGQIFGGKGDVNLETIISLNPDLLIDIGEKKEGIEEDLDKLQEQTGIPIIHIDASLFDMAQAYRMLGDLLGRVQKAEELAVYCDDILDKTQTMLLDIGEAGKKSVVYCLGDKGLNVLAKGSYHAELLDMLCNNSAVLDNPISSGMGNEIDMEQLMLWNPEYIIFAPDSLYDQVESDPLWTQLSAIKNEKYFQTPQGPYNWMGMPPSVNRYMGMVWLSSILYPENSPYKLYDEAKKYYKLFYNCNLTLELFNQLIE
ncbi:MAG: ABC transporter substrate-binding protein [Clostridia bacterium]|nr:ABC transporter substrate-binding protein [Clostridia bacterium]